MSDFEFQNLLYLAEVSSYKPELLQLPYFYDPLVSTDFSLNILETVPCITSQNSLMQCTACIYTLKVNCCLDTGASVVFINQSVVEEVLRKGLQLNIKRIGKPMTVKLGDSSTSVCDKQVELPLTFNESIYPITAYVLKNLTYDIMLGMSFFTKYGASIHPFTKTLMLDTDFNPPTTVIEDPHLYLIEAICQ